MDSAASWPPSRASGRSTGFSACCTWPSEERDMFAELKPGFRMMLVMTVLTGLVYPAVITAIAQIAFRDRANGSLVLSNGHVVGSRLIGQAFTRPEYFPPRPSAAGSGYDAAASGGSNLGPTSAKLVNGATKIDDKKNEVVDFDGIKDRIVHYCLDNRSEEHTSELQ